MKISIIIPTFNPDYEGFSRLLSQIKTQTIQYELIIIDSGSQGDIVSLSKQYADHFIQIEQSDFNHGHTRNLAVKYAKGDFLLFITQDIIPANNKLLENLLTSFSIDNKIAIAYARQLPKNDALPTEKFSRYFNYPKLSTLKSIKEIDVLGIKTFFTSNSCCMYRKDVFDELHGFASVNTSEDMEFAARALNDGYKIYYNAEALIVHSHQYSFVTLYKRYFNIGRFFKNHQWILKLAPTKNEGKKYLISITLYLIRHNNYSALFRSLIENLIKIIAYKHGEIF